MITYFVLQSNTFVAVVVIVDTVVSSGSWTMH